jgi:hypothetical protein
MRKKVFAIKICGNCRARKICIYVVQRHLHVGNKYFLVAHGESPSIAGSQEQAAMYAPTGELRVNTSADEKSCGHKQHQRAWKYTQLKIVLLHGFYLELSMLRRSAAGK